MKRVYVVLLRLYPRDYRARFATEMAGAFEDASRDRRRRGLGVYLRFVLGELAGLATGAAVEWIAKLTTNASVRGRSLPDRLLMRPPGVSWDAHYAGAFLPDEVRQARQHTDALVQRMVHAISRHEFLQARALSEQERQARENPRMLRAKYQIDE